MTNAMLAQKQSKKSVHEPEKLADEMAEKVVELLGRAPGVGKIRKSHILSAIIGVAGLALFIVGVEKIFADLPGLASALLGLALMALGGVLFQNLSR